MGYLLKSFNFNNGFGIECHETLFDRLDNFLRRFRPRNLKERERHDDTMMMMFVLCVSRCCWDEKRNQNGGCSCFDFNYSSL